MIIEKEVTLNTLQYDEVPVGKGNNTQFIIEELENPKEPMQIEEPLQQPLNVRIKSKIWKKR